MSAAAEYGLREALERLHHPVDGCECDRGCAWPGDDGRCAPPTRCEHCRTPWPCRTGALLAEHQPTAREGACIHCHRTEAEHGAAGECLAAGYYGNRFDPQPAPVAPAGEVRLSEEELADLLSAVPHAPGTPAVQLGDIPRLRAVVERILAVRLAAAEQRLAAVRALADERLAVHGPHIECNNAGCRRRGLSGMHCAGPCEEPHEDCADFAAWTKARAALGDADGGGERG